MDGCLYRYSGRCGRRIKRRLDLGSGRDIRKRNRAFDNGEAVLTCDAAGDSRFGAGASMEDAMRNERAEGTRLREERKSEDE